MKAVVAAFNQEKALVGAFSVITNLWMELFEALVTSDHATSARCRQAAPSHRPLCLHPWAGAGERVSARPRL